MVRDGDRTETGRGGKFSHRALFAKTVRTVVRVHPLSSTSPPKYTQQSGMRHTALCFASLADETFCGIHNSVLLILCINMCFQLYCWVYCFGGGGVCCAGKEKRCKQIFPLPPGSVLSPSLPQKMNFLRCAKSVVRISILFLPTDKNMISNRIFTTVKRYSKDWTPAYQRNNKMFRIQQRFDI